MSLTSASHSSSINIPLSVLDLAPIVEGSDPQETFKKSMELAQQVDRLNYHRYWLAEHHSMPGIASAATSVLIGYIAGGTKRIRVGSGGVMLPNHARWSSRSNSVLWNPCIRDELILDWDVHQARISRRHARCAATYR